MPLIRRRPVLAPGEQRKRFGLLLLAISAAFAVQGIAQPGRWEQLIVAVLLAITLLLALWVAETGPAIFRPIAAIAGLLVVAALIEAIIGNGNGTVARVANLLLVTLTPPAIIVGITRTLRARNRVTIEAVFGVLCLYLLIGMFFAFVYATIGRIRGSFFTEHVAVSAANCLYFSFTTLTTTGYGDLTAASNLGHTLSVSEALVGQIYLVTVVALIVSNLRPGAVGASQSAEEG
ncbi:MAG: potassium channel family protein [Solirubrobacteraceae bacterium]